MSNPRGEEEELPARADRDYFPPLGEKIESPDKTCLGCLIGVGMVVLAVIVWAFVYWRLNPELSH